MNHRLGCGKDYSKDNTMKIGITGTREGMSEVQFEKLQSLLSQFLHEAKSKGIVPEFHHGDCKGVDVQAACLAREMGFYVVCHPPIKTDTQGFFGGDESKEPHGYMQRDRNIVNDTDFLIVVPKHTEWQPSGGTWYTHDYAKKKNKPFTIIWPNEQHIVKPNVFNGG